jgi:divalent metal cation (Fe/Co/Zn/Cd) transporter
LPRAQHSENIFDRIRAVATHRNLNVHDISVRTLLDNVEQHIELDERMTLKDAHDEVTELEAEMRRDVPEIAKILTHIESEPATIERPEELVGDAELEHRLKTVAAQFPEILDVHDFIFKRVRGRLYVSCHCTLSDNLSLARAMLHSDQLEFVSSRTRRSCFACLSIPNQHR